VSTGVPGLDEMVNGGYGYHRVWGNIVRYIEQVDVERIRAQRQPVRDGRLHDLRHHAVLHGDVVERWRIRTE